MSMCAFRSNKASPSRTGRESLFREASENDPSSRLSLELFRWCRRRRKKLLLAEPDPRLVGPFSSSESCRLRFSDKLLLNTRSSSSLQNIVQKYSDTKNKEQIGAKPLHILDNFRIFGFFVDSF